METAETILSLASGLKETGVSISIDGVLVDLNQCGRYFLSSAAVLCTFLSLQQKQVGDNFD